MFDVLYNHEERIHELVNNSKSDPYCLICSVGFFVCFNVRIGSAH